MTRWASRDTRTLRRLFGKGFTDRQIAGEIGRSVQSVKARRFTLGLVNATHKLTEEQKDLVRREYRHGAEALAKKLGRSVSGVYQAAKRLKLTCSRMSTAERSELHEFIRAKNSLEWTDREIANEWTATHSADRAVSREWVSEVRRKLGLPGRQFAAKAAAKAFLCT